MQTTKNVAIFVVKFTDQKTTENMKFCLKI